MNRDERRQLKYKALKDAGFNAKEATRYKDRSWKKIQLLVQEKIKLDKKIQKLEKEMQERINEGW